MHNIGIISDTHGVLRDEAAELMRGADHIIHAGDIGRPEIVPALQALAPVTAIRGNVDVTEWALKFPETIRLELFGRVFFVIHDRKELAMRAAEEGVSAVISGHSHRPGVETKDGVLYVNPGSAGPRRFRLPVTVATLRITDDGIFPQLHEIV